MRQITTLFQPSTPFHPGEILQDVWPEGLSLSVAAQQLGLSLSILANILNGATDITPSIAEKLHGWGGISAERWMRLQATHLMWIEDHRSHSREGEMSDIDSLCSD